MCTHLILLDLLDSNYTSQSLFSEHTQYSFLWIRDSYQWPLVVLRIKYFLQNYINMEFEVSHIKGKMITYADDTSILNMGIDPEELKPAISINTRQVNTVLWSNLYINLKQIIYCSQQNKADMTLIYKSVLKIKKSERKSDSFLVLLLTLIQLGRHILTKSTIRLHPTYLYTINQLSKVTELAVRRAMYYGLLYSFLSYGITIQGLSAKKYNTKWQYIFQKKMGIVQI